MATHSRDAMLAALQQAAAYPHATTGLAHHSTHISDVFLAGDYAYKLKKPVDFGFLDFTTLDKRRRACEDEVRLNARLAPEIYLGVAPVCAGTGIHLRPDGCRAGETLLDVAVRMRRLPEDGLFDRLAARGELTRELLIDVATQIAALHARTDHGPAVARHATAEALAGPVRQNFDQTERFVGTVVSEADFRALRDWQLGFLAHEGARFDARIAAGRIVDGHGDLHLRNLCRMDGRAVIFDCLEFNAALRAGDAINDIAFLIMDLDHRGLAPLANAFLNHYLVLTDDYAGLPLLDFYLSYRATVRAKVACLEMNERPDPAHIAQARGYFDLARRYSRPRRGGVLLTCGVSGSGKTTVAHAACETLDGVIVRSDAVRKHLAGLPLLARGDETLYSRAMTARTYAQLLAHAREVLASGRWAVLDAVHARRDERDAAAALAREHGVAFGILYCEAGEEELTRRLRQRSAAGTDISDAGESVLAAQQRFFEKPLAGEGPVCAGTDEAVCRRWLQSLAGAGRD